MKLLFPFVLNLNKILFDLKKKLHPQRVKISDKTILKCLSEIRRQRKRLSLLKRHYLDFFKTTCLCCDGKMEEEKKPLKADKKAAKQFAREQKQIQLRKDILGRELALDEITLGKIKDKWYDKIFDAKIPELQDNLRHILHYMEKLIEAENFRKSCFEDERQELEEKSTLMAQSHGSALETLIDIYQKRIQDLHSSYNGVVSERKTQAEEEFSAIDEKEKITEENMHTMLYQMHENREKKEEMMNCDMFLKIDDEISKNTEIQETLRTKLERKMERRWGEITATLNRYEESTRARRAEYSLLKSKDDSDSKIIHQQMKKTQKLFEQLEELKRCMDDCYAPKETISLITDLREERTKFFNTFTQLKLILDEELTEDNLNLKLLTLATNATINNLKQICKKGEQILTLFRICRRFETQLEKIMPVGDFLNFPKSNLLMEPRKKGKAKADSEDKTPDKNFEMFIKDLNVLKNFWRKVAKVKLSKLSLGKCVDKLEKENEFLRGILASYLKEASNKILGL